MPAETANIQLEVAAGVVDVTLRGVVMAWAALRTALVIGRNSQSLPQGASPAQTRVAAKVRVV